MTPTTRRKTTPRPMMTKTTPRKNGIKAVCVRRTTPGRPKHLPKSAKLLKQSVPRSTNSAKPMPNGSICSKG